MKLNDVAFLVPDLLDEDTLFALYLVLTASGIGVVTVCCCLVNHHLPLALVGCLFVNLIVSALELAIITLTLDPLDADMVFLLALINLSTMVVVGVGFLSSRPTGLRLWTIRDSVG